MATAPINIEERWLLGCVQRGHREIFAAHAKLTPTLARLLLDRNPENRIETPGNTAKFVSDIKEGRFMLTGQGLIVSRDGLLNDGQHRCRAVIQTGITVETLIVFGIEREARLATDIGKNRDAADMLSMAGVQNAKTCAAVSRLLVAWNPNTQGFTDRGVSTPAVCDFFHAHIDRVQAAANLATKYKPKFRGASPAALAFSFYVLGSIDEELALKFMHDLCTGEMLEAGNPALVARNRLLNERQKNPNQNSLPVAQMLEIIFRAWLAYRAGGTLKTIRTDGSIPNPGLRPNGRPQ